MFYREGNRYTMKELSETFGIAYATLTNRLNAGWDLEKALFKPIGNTQNGFAGKRIPRNGNETE